ncbi:hypothetical protein B5807_05567 [Epicoccum nigrum]|jgi:hypothetical protein|uniref:Uncharacterized protein n=1 Tax=Epicoccum nigrum TaxID=105696 RepID=A0A1Y2LZU4_EPING|nr:hypothetical protein B5807_05567 [Epicoccum nigrum]
MFSTTALVLCLVILLRTISASPLPHDHKLEKRNTTSQNVGSGFAIAICIVLLAGVFYYLGMNHERTKLWFSTRKAHAAAEPDEDPKTSTDSRGHKRQISCPLAVSSSAPIKPYDDPIEAPTPSVRCYELPIKEVHEMGLPSPRKPPPRASWLSLDRKPWWLKYPEQNETRESVRTSRQSTGTSRSKSMRSWFRGERGMEAVQESVPMPSPNTLLTPNTLPSPAIISSPNTPTAVHLNPEPTEEEERKSHGSALTPMDWSGLDYVRKIYVGRKSRVGL